VQLLADRDPASRIDAQAPPLTAQRAILAS
jgi:hypothetical protein